MELCIIELKLKMKKSVPLPMIKSTKKKPLKILANPKKSKILLI